VTDAAVQRVVAARWPGATVVGVRPLKAWNRAVVTRCRLRGGGAPASVVAKQFKAPGERAWDEWASLSFLTALGPPAARLAPCFLAGDARSAVFLMEDLGEGQTLEDTLTAINRPDAPAAGRAALLDLAHTVGTLQAATVGRESDYTSMRQSLAPVTEPVRYERARELDRGWAVLEQALGLVGAGAARAAAARNEHASMVRTLAEPGDLLVFTHGDVAPSNAFLAAGACRLLDFEYGGYRHALYDTIFWRVLCPLPSGLADEMDAAYRRALATGCPSVEDDATYCAARSALALYGAWRTVIWHLHAALNRDVPWVGAMTLRAALVFHLGNAAAIAGRDRCYPALAALARDLARHLSGLWGEEATHVEPWPAFAAPAQERAIIGS
jgi:hypothetical protein